MFAQLCYDLYDEWMSKNNVFFIEKDRIFYIYIKKGASDLEQPGQWNTRTKESLKVFTYKMEKRCSKDARNV